MRKQRQTACRSLICCAEGLEYVNLVAVTKDDDVDEPQYTIFTLPEMLRDEHRRLHGRMTDVVGFELPMTEEAIEQLIMGEGTGREEGQERPSTWVPAEVHAAVLEALPEGAQPKYYEADSGRGASGYAIALELVGFVANVGGAATTVWLGAKGIRNLYDRIRRQLGHPPLISLGTATYLAAADLSERIGSHEFELYGSGDARTHAEDSSYSGYDYFYVFFEKNRVLYSYIVDARGQVHFQTELPMPDELS